VGGFRFRIFRPSSRPDIAYCTDRIEEVKQDHPEFASLEQQRRHFVEELRCAN